MAHVRKQIRTAVAGLVTGLPTTGTRVFVSRAETLAVTLMPALLVYALEETSGPSIMGRPHRLDRVLTVAVEIVAEATSAVDDQVDLIAKEIEVAMAADVTFGGLAQKSWLSETVIEFDEAGEKPVAGARLAYAVQYRTDAADPETAL